MNSMESEDDCVICFCEIGDEPVHQLLCGHFFHVDCLMGLSASDGETIANSMYCFKNHEEKQPYCIKDVIENPSISSEERTMFMEKLLDYYVSQNSSKITYCPNAQCGAVIHKTLATGGKKEELYCPNEEECGGKWCSNCWGEAHGDTFCKGELEKLQEEFAKMGDLKKCPHEGCGKLQV